MVISSDLCLDSFGSARTLSVGMDMMETVERVTLTSDRKIVASRIYYRMPDFG
jgi:hypothetical protein